MERSTLLLAFLAAGEGKEYTYSQICKGMFLVSLNCAPPEDFYKFYPGDYGPSCLFDTLSGDLALLQRRGEIHFFQGNVNQAYGRVACSIQGFRTDRQNQEIPPIVRNRIKAVSDWILPLSFDQMISSLREAYPRMFEKAAFR